MFVELLSILFYGIGDLWTTRIITRNLYGNEMNPIVKTILKKTGFSGLIVSKIIVMLIVFLYFYSLLLILAVVGCAAVIWNVAQIVSHNRTKITEVIKNACTGN